MSKNPSITLTPGQAAVLKAFGTLGTVTDAAVASFVHHMDPTNLSSSGVRTRRCELERAGLIEEVGAVKLKSGRHAKTHDLTKQGLSALKQVAR